MTPIERYQADLRQGDFLADPAQAVVMQRIQALYEELLVAPAPAPSLLQKVLGRRGAGGRGPVKGVYLWGSVGRGKTYLMDCFFESLPIQNKLRTHFHRFMQSIHHELKGLPDAVDPLVEVAARFRRRTRVLCFDEFHVADITDAMLLGRLLAAFFEQGITLVTTSNEEPDRLYWDGLQRGQFIPAIELLKRHTHVMRLDGDLDYRLRALERAPVYHSPLGTAAQAGLVDTFDQLAPHSHSEPVVIEIEGRKIDTVRCAVGLVWFEFAVICGGPRSAADYIEIGLCYHTVLISNIPIMDADMDDQAKRLMNLVDELYDRNVKLVASAQTEPDGIYFGGRHVQTFRRTISRLEEMRTHSYLARRHLS